MDIPMRHLRLALTLLAFAAPALSADAVKGKQLFHAQCALCHSAAPGDNGGAQGPNLATVLGRKAATQPGFSYTPALIASKLTWDAATLSRFLASPTTVVPGTAMVIALPEKEDRDNAIAYLDALEKDTYQDPVKPAPAAPAAPAPAAQTRSGADWKLDALGRVHHIEADKLPPPYDTPGASNSPRFVAKPAGASLQLPPGFEASVFSMNSGLQNPRTMRLAPNGDIIVVESSPGRVKIMRPRADGKTAASIFTFARGLDQPFGIALYPAGDHPEWLYVGEVNRVVRYAYTPGQTEARGTPEVVIPALAPDMSGGHVTRDLAFSPDGKRLYVSVGSQSNVPDDLPMKTPKQIQDWERKSMVGAAWGMEEQRAAVLEFDVEKPGAARFFATGLRNCVGLTMHPSGDLWCTVNERDMLGDDLVPDYSTRVKPGAFYGWPWYYLGEHEDPRLAGLRPDLKGKITVPDVLYQAHSAAITLTFYPSNAKPDKGAAAFPKEYQGDGFVAMHGSWNRAFRTGHKIVRVRMNDGVPTGEYEDFMVGFITEEGDAWGRPAGTVVAADGALLVSEDAGNVIYRIAYRPGVDVVGEDISPESMTSLADGTVIVGSSRRTIYRAPPGESRTTPWIRLEPTSPPMVFGVLADEKSNTLWACVGSIGRSETPPARSALYAFDLESGAQKAHYALPAKDSLCNDIAVGADGSVYVTDTVNNEISRLAPGADSLKSWLRSGFGKQDAGLDGIAVLGSRVLVNTIDGNQLFAVPIASNGKAGKAVEITLDRALETPDGMRSDGENTLLVAENLPNGRVVRVQIDGDRGVISPVETELPRGVNAVTASGKSIWALETKPAASEGKQRRVRVVRIQ
jgi:glucose/arabinose dehydrogenase/cytochrome c2